MSQREIQDRYSRIPMGVEAEHGDPWFAGAASLPGGDPLDDVILYDERDLAIFEPVILEIADAGLRSTPPAG